MSKRIRSISEILIEADKTNELSILTDCLNEVVRNKYNYTLAEIRFVKEHLTELAREMARRDAKKFRSIFDTFLRSIH